ncbi:MAG: twin-arginine translocase TatA/TatE family subunit [Gemmatimonadales bacterium]|jgi:sec-independent protein translocase protein TatA|nr:twin-arginine translocase TatA/TatE family subunit [Gemmatimonadales bacterium]
MPNLGFTEIMVLLVVALLVFGAKRLPEMGASMGKGIREFQRSLKQTQDDVLKNDDHANDRRLDGGGIADQAPTTSGEPKRLSQ